MTEADRRLWDERYAKEGRAQLGMLTAPGFLLTHADLLPATGLALDVACGQGLSSVWLSARGLDVWGFDISAVAIRYARDLARHNGATARCRFDVVDLDHGLPAGPPVDVILCNRFRDPLLDQVFVERLAPGGILAIAVLSEVGAAAGPFRAAPGELLAAFAQLDVVASGEGAGSAWLLARA